MFGCNLNFLGKYRMKRINYLLLFLILLLGSCTSSKYYYSTMSSNDPYTSKNEKGEFVITGDSVDIIYSFYGRNAPITIGVNNKGSRPIYIDWRRSGVVIDEKSITFKEPMDEKNYNVVDEYGRFLNDPEGLSIIKPYSLVSTQVLELSNFRFQKIPDEKFLQTHTVADRKGKNKQYKNISYTETDSPIYLSIFLTIYDEVEAIHDPLIYEANFFMSELIRGEKTSPSKIYALKNKQGDSFFVRYKKDTAWKKIGNTSLKILGGAAIVTGNIIVWALESGGSGD